MKRDLNATHGLQEGVKLARAAAESYGNEHAKAAAQQRPQSGNPTRKSNIFLAIQPAIHTADDLLAPATGLDSEDSEKVVSFAIHLHDPEHGLSFSALSQALPLQWLDWLDAPPPASLGPGEWALPDVIRGIVQTGGVDPREWVVDWVEEAVGLSVGVVAQKYVAKRMRVGEAGDAAVEEKAGEINEKASEAREEAPEVKQKAHEAMAKEDDNDNDDDDDDDGEEEDDDDDDEEDEEDDEANCDDDDDDDDGESDDEEEPRAAAKK